MDRAIPADLEHVPGRGACEFRSFRRGGRRRTHCSGSAVSFEPLPESGLLMNRTEKHWKPGGDSILSAGLLCFEEHAIALFGPIGERFIGHVPSSDGIDMGDGKEFQAPPP